VSIHNSTAGIMTCINCGFVGANIFINNAGPYCGKCAEQHSPTNYYPISPNSTSEPIVVNRACPYNCPGNRPDDGSYDKAVDELLRQAQNAALDFDQFVNPAIDSGAWPNMHRFNITPRKLEEAIAAVRKAREERGK
jgi:hypothetical protein